MTTHNKESGVITDPKQKCSECKVTHCKHYESDFDRYIADDFLGKAKEIFRPILEGYYDDHNQIWEGLEEVIAVVSLKAEERGRQEILNNLVSECQEVEIPWLTCKKLCEALTQDTETLQDKK